MNAPKAYDPKQNEEQIYQLWESRRAFAPGEAKEHFSIVVPPPNANANLHIGFGLVMALEDIMIRYNRLKAKATLFVPGADHAGFETQSVYEKQLVKEGKSRFDFSREDLYKLVWDFVAQNRENFQYQFRRLGASVDWERYTFTLDDKVVRQAYATFKKMWDEGLVYRGERLVNYCTFHGTAFADIEVEYKQDAGKLWHIRYLLADGSGEIMVATTRPETMLGDVAVAVHPDDERYKALVGKMVKLPLTDREIPIIADDFVDQAFGSGAVKITPAHDPNDYDVAGRHELPLITVIAFDGTMSDGVPEAYRNLSTTEARKKIVTDLESQDLLDHVDDYTHSVGHCYKCGTVIEPLLKEQWFVDMKPLATVAITSLKADKIAFYPETKKDQLIHYLEQLKDWNISRQIAWGIPIPAFQSVDNPKEWIYDDRVTEETIEVNSKTYRRDPDVFDTWFSSSSWPYVTLNFPDGEDFKKFYPLSVMETGGEILYPWVSRMIMLGLYVTGEIPFKSVYIHGYVMAEDGSKMSKSVGNTIDLMEVIDQYGSDAVRMGLIAGRSPGVNRGFDRRRVEEARNFANKLWNIARYIEGAIPENTEVDTKPQPTTAADEWILSRLSTAIETITSLLDEFRFAEAYEALYHLVWDDVADWYIEASKSALNPSVLRYTLRTILTLAHPFAPFITEAIWQTIPDKTSELLITAEWPKPPSFAAHKAAEFATLTAVIGEVRHIQSVLSTSGHVLYYRDSLPLLQDNKELLLRLAKLADVRSVSDGTGLHLTTLDSQGWLDIESELAASYAQKLQQQLSELHNLQKTLEARLANDHYVKNAPSEVVNETKDSLKATQLHIQQLTEEISRFNNL